ncbi:MAG: hypothetical protein Q8Q29_06350 [Actinomycetota bacterium]|jgi:hypothetical protein|nr:hypothetical protein [Actinomycetota bacterium]
MGRLRRFPNHRFVGTRDDMVVHDCDDEARFSALEARVAADDLERRNLLAGFGPDTLAEARNRGFSAR